MKNKLFTFLTILSMGLMSCRPEIDVSVLDSSVFDYNYQLFIQNQSNDTVQVDKWNKYEIYLKPIATNKLKDFSKSIIISPTITSGISGYYQIFSTNGDTLSTIQRFGDVVTISSDSFIDNRCWINEKIMEPNARGSLIQTTSIIWNSVRKVTTNNIYLK